MGVGSFGDTYLSRANDVNRILQRDKSLIYYKSEVTQNIKI
jgi:hypothetical protein